MDMAQGQVMATAVDAEAGNYSSPSFIKKALALI